MTTALKQNQLFFWLLAGQVLMLAPHAIREPSLLWFYCLAVMAFVLLVAQKGRVFMPGWTKLLALSVGCITLWISFNELFSVMFWVGLLSFMYVVKLLELKTDRDHYQILLLGFFVALTHFLFSETIAQTMYTVLCLWVICATLLLMQAKPGNLRGIQPLIKASSTILLAIPLLVVLFVLFPRITPFWTIPLDRTSALTGLSERLVLGDIDRLVRSDELVFRATFKGTPPPSSALYWRTLVLSEFSGNAWQRGRPPVFDQPEMTYQQNIDYQLLTQPLPITFVPSLAYVRRAQGEGVDVSPMGYVRSQQPLGSVSQFSMQSALKVEYQGRLTERTRAYYLRLDDSNPQARSYGQILEKTWPNPRDRANHVLNWFREEFTYSLSPGALEGTNVIDAFLFDTKRGFCEHFAASFTLLMRSAGVPARIVLGYQGGEFNALGNYVEVRQFDAHAWSEIWIKGIGWQRIDPTNAIAPERIERGMSGLAMSGASLIGDATWGYFQLRSLVWLYDLQMRLEAIGHLWDRTVVNYDQAQQWALLSGFWPELKKTDLGHIALVAFLLSLGLLAIGVLWDQMGTKRSRTAQWYRDFARCASGEGFKAQGVGEGVVTMHRRWQRQAPEEAELADEFVAIFMAHEYQHVKIDKKSVSRALWRLKFQLFRLRWLQLARWRQLARRAMLAAAIWFRMPRQ